MPTRARQRPQRPGDPLTLAKLCLAAAARKKAENPLLLDVASLSGYADYFLILSGRSTRQAAAIAESIQSALKKSGVKLIGADGVREGRWAVLDFGDVVVHVFHQPVREFYDLEALWADAPRVEADPEELADWLPPEGGRAAAQEG
ncbi:MAG: ribosome silencing factor [Thermodesulfobacteriota bacterium]